MKRLLSTILALTLAAGSVPAQAQTAFVRASLPTGVSAPTPVPGGLVAAPGVLAPALSAPALTVSLAAAPAVPLMPIVALAVQAAAPLPVTHAVPAAGPAPAEAPLDTLRRASSPAATRDLGAVFDGSRSAAAAPESDAPPAAAAAPRKNLLQRYQERRNKTPLQNAFGSAVFATAMAAAVTPVLWGAVPAMKFGYAIAVADALILAAVLPLYIAVAAWRKVRGAPQTASKPPPSRRAKLAVIAAGVLFGLGAAITPYHAVGPIAERVEMYLDRNRPAEEVSNKRWITGGAVEDETIQLLSRNPVGREILEGLRDRGGVIRLPTFFVSKQESSYAQHENFFDGVYFSQDEITGRGWTVEQFLKDPSLQRRLVREMDVTVVHELVHAVQGRRPPWTKGYFSMSMEAEQEAFFRETLFRLAELERDPAARNDGSDSWMLPMVAADIDNFLTTVADMYEKNVVVGEPYFNAFLAEQRARWPAFRVHIYQVLSARASNPTSAKMYLDKAKAAAKAAGLPEPAALADSR